MFMVVAYDCHIVFLHVPRTVIISFITIATLLPMTGKIWNFCWYSQQWLCVQVVNHSYASYHENWKLPLSLNCLSTAAVLYLRRNHLISSLAIWRSKRNSSFNKKWSKCSKNNKERFSSSRESQGKLEVSIPSKVPNNSYLCRT